MRFVAFLVGLVLGIAGTLAYAMFETSSSVSAVSPAPVLPSNPQITVTLGDDFLTAIVRRAALQTPGVADARTNIVTELRDQTIVVHVNIDVLGRTAEGSATLRPMVRDGRLRIEVVDTSLGTTSLPAIEGVLEREVNQRIGSLLSGMPVTITGVAVDPSRGLTITCSVDLARLDLSDAAP